MTAEDRPRILLVSGDLTLRERLYGLLTGCGYSVRTVVNGTMAVDAVIHERPHLIIANSRADDCPGWGLPDWIRRHDQKTPIIVLGHPDNEPPDPQTARDIQAYFSIGVEDAELVRAVKRWLQHSAPPGLDAHIDYPGIILAIDDEPEILRALQNFLRSRGCTVATASAGEEGLKRLEGSNYTLVLLDVKMPGMDGLMTLKKIKERQPDLPVIMVSAVEDKDLIAQALGLGAFDYITKPLDLDSLQSLLTYLKSSQPPG